MNFDFTDREKAFFDEVKVAMGSVRKIRELESKDIKAIRKNLLAVLNGLRTCGYLQLALAGQDAPVSGTLSLMAAMEKVAGVSYSGFLGVEMSSRMFGRALTLGDPKAAADILEELTAGRIVGALALSEGSLNVENDPLATTGSRDGEVYLVNGSKSFVINGPVADWFAVVGRIEEQAALFLVEKQTPGLTLTDRLTTMGYGGLAVGGLELNGCRVPAGRVIGPMETGTCLGQLKLWENQILIAASLGLMQGSYETARDYAKTHRSGGKPIIAYQEVGFKLAEMLTLYQTAQLYAYRAAWSADDNPREAGVLTLCAKVFCTEAAETVAGKSLQIQSKDGYLAGGAAEQAYRCAKYGQIAGVSTEIARVKIGDAALGKL